MPHNSCLRKPEILAVLVTRPHPDDETTAATLRGRGLEVLQAPMLRFEAVAFNNDEDVRYGAVVVTSANALRGLTPHLGDSRLLKLPLFAVTLIPVPSARVAVRASPLAALANCRFENAATPATAAALLVALPLRALSASPMAILDVTAVALLPDSVTVTAGAGDMVAPVATLDGGCVVKPIA